MKQQEAGIFGDREANTYGIKKNPNDNEAGKDKRAPTQNKTGVFVPSKQMVFGKDRGLIPQGN